MTYSILGRKGNVPLDGLTVMIVLFLAVLVLPIIWVTVSPVLTGVEGATQGFFGSDIQLGLTNFNDKIPAIIDYFMLFLLIGSLAGIIVASFLVDSHPIFLAISIPLFTFVLFVTILLGNFSEEYIRSFGTIETELPIAFFISTHLLEVVLVSGLLIALVLYGKNRFATGGSI